MSASPDPDSELFPDDPERATARAAWKGAGTMSELGELAARFLEGDLPFFPGWMADDIDEETDDLVPVLAGCCRAGFLTLASQPAAGESITHDGRPWRRRAFVMGFANQVAWERLRELDSGTLSVAAFGAGESRDVEPVPVGEMGGEPYLFAGTASGPEELAIFEDQVAPGGLGALRGTRFVSVIDSNWGEDGRLWDALARALPGRYNPISR